MYDDLFLVEIMEALYVYKHYRFGFYFKLSKLVVLQSRQHIVIMYYDKIMKVHTLGWML